MRLLPAVLLSMAIVIGAVIVVSVPMFFPPGGNTAALGAVDNRARIDNELLHGDLEKLAATVRELSDQIDSLENRVNRIEAAAAAPDASGNPLQIVTPEGPNLISGNYAKVVLVADRRGLNKGLTVPTPSFMLGKFGAPADKLSDSCSQMTNTRLSALLKHATVGPVTVTMVRPAIESLRTVFANIMRADPDLYSRINTAGALCVRLIRGSTSAVSDHSFGTAVDLNIDGVLDTPGDGRTQLGLTILADFFNAEGWVWGAAYGREDSMHFEVSEEKLDKWIAEGKI